MTRHLCSLRGPKDPRRRCIRLQAPNRRRINLALGPRRVMNGVVMTTFTIEPENNITAFASVKEVRASHIEQAEYFSSQEDLGKLAVSWPAARLIEIWNSLTGATPATK